MNRSNVTLQRLRELYVEGENDVIVKLLTAKRTLTPRESVYLVSAFINIDNDAAAIRYINEALPRAEGADKADLIALSALIASVRGDEDGYLRLSREAVAVHATPLALHHLGLALPDVREGIRILQGALRAAEEAADAYAEARSAYALALSYLRIGSFRESLGWSHFAYTRTAHPVLRLVVLNLRAYTKILVESTEGLEALLKGTLDATEKTAYAFQRRQTLTTLADLYQAQGRYKEALALYETALEQAPRHLWAMLTYGCVKALRALGRQREAEELAETAVSVTRNLALYYQDYAMLVLGVSRWPSEAGVRLLDEVYPRLSDIVLTSEATFYLAAAEQLGMKLQRSYVALARELRRPLTTTGLRLLAGEALPYLEPLFVEEHALRVHVLGTLEVYQRGNFVRVRQRTAELLALLLQEPRGYTAEALSEALYGTLQLSALRVELHRLRKDLGLTVHTQPYRLGTPLWADVLEVGQALNEGRVKDAVALYRGPLLPTSTSPGITELRRGLEAELQGAVLAAEDVELLWSLAQIMPYDLELWEALRERP